MNRTTPYERGLVQISSKLEPLAVRFIWTPNDDAGDPGLCLIRLDTVSDYPQQFPMHHSE